MKSLPILLNAHEVRTIPSGTQTQIRRIIKPQPFGGNGYHDGDIQMAGWVPGSTGDPACARFTVGSVGGGALLVECRECPFGAVGDRLWGRETTSESEPCFLGGRAQPTVWYRADNNRPRRAERRWTPSIHMPRRLSRIDLEITEIRVQRLQDITWVDAIAEGIHDPRRSQMRIDPITGCVAKFRELWESIYGAGSWALNPWLWCLAFKAHQPAQTECVK